MKSFRDNPDGLENQSAQKQNEREVFALKMQYRRELDEIMNPETPNEDGGAAFPGFLYTPGYGCSKKGAGGEWETYSPGMTLRDWFAGQVLAGMVSAPSDSLSQDLGPNLRAGSSEAMSNAAAIAYGVADEMLRARGTP